MAFCFRGPNFGDVDNVDNVEAQLVEAATSGTANVIAVERRRLLDIVCFFFDAFDVVE